MGMLQTLNYKGKEILYADFSGKSGKELESRILEMQKEVCDSMKKDFLMLVNYQNTFASNEVMKALGSENGKTMTARCRKFAVIGITGVKKVLLKSVNMFSQNKVVPFDSEEAAKEYLVSG